MPMAPPRIFLRFLKNWNRIPRPLCGRAVGSGLPPRDNLQRQYARLAFSAECRIKLGASRSCHAVGIGRINRLSS